MTVWKTPSCKKQLRNALMFFLSYAVLQNIDSALSLSPKCMPMSMPF